MAVGGFGLLLNNDAQNRRRHCRVAANTHQTVSVVVVVIDTMALIAFGYIVLQQRAVANDARPCIARHVNLDIRDIHIHHVYAFGSIMAYFRSDQPWNVVYSPPNDRLPGWCEVDKTNEKLSRTIFLTAG